jgi:glycosyltransferase involved in cell wall biosynthesis
MPSLLTHIRPAIKTLVNGSYTVKHAYAAFRWYRASRLQARKQYYAALVELCEALRQVRDTKITHRHADTVQTLLYAACYQGESLAPHRENKLYNEFLERPEARTTWQRFQTEPVEDRLRLRRHRDDGDAERQGHMIILKACDQKTGERGVLLLKYNGTFEVFASLYTLTEILPYYRVVFEPSWSFNYIPSLFLYTGSDFEGVIQSQYDEDYEFFTRCHPCLTPVRLCASDWVDSDLFVPKDGPRQYDVVMVASWLSIKRHQDLLRALAKLKPRKLRTALIGYPMDLTLEDIRRLMRRYGVEDQCETFESLPPERVADIVADSKVSVLLSKQEGNPKAPYEALFCNTPIILHRQNLGIRRSTINEKTGLWADNTDLAEAISYIIDNPSRFRPREWALANSGYRRATRQISDALREMAVACGEPWTQNILPKVNRPNLRYLSRADQSAMQPSYEHIRKYLRATLDRTTDRRSTSTRGSQ